MSGSGEQKVEAAWEVPPSEPKLADLGREMSFAGAVSPGSSGVVHDAHDPYRTISSPISNIIHGLVLRTRAVLWRRDFGDIGSVLDF